MSTPSEWVAARRALSQQPAIEGTPDTTNRDNLAVAYANAAPGAATRSRGMAHNVPRDFIDKQETTLPIPTPARQGPDSTLYQTFACMAGIVSGDQSSSITGALAAGAEAQFRASAVPEKWRVIITCTAAAILWVDPGEGVQFPCEFVMCGANSSAVLVVPGRGMKLSVRADPANTQPLTIIATAIAGIAAEII